MEYEQSFQELFGKQACVNWRENRFTLVSLMALLEVNARAFYRAFLFIAQTVERVKLGNPESLDVQEIRKTMDMLEPELQKLELDLSLAHVERIQEVLQAEQISQTKLSDQMRELAWRMRDEMEAVQFLSLSPKSVPYYEQPELLCGKDVAAKFPNLATDIAEAGQCFALNRYTACVFHLMRVMESGLQAFGAKLTVTLVAKKNWQNILDEANKAITGLKAVNDPRAQDYAAIAAHLFNVKVAWRNEVMHPKATYTDEEAERIFDAVKAFMSELAQVI